MSTEHDRISRFENNFHRLYASLCRTAIFYLRSPDISEDVVQEVMVRLWNNGKDALTDDDFAAYAYTAVVNASLNELRRQKARAGISIDDPDGLFVEELEQEQPGNTADENAERLEPVLQLLPAKCRTVFEMSKLQGMKYSEIAYQLGISIKTVENHMGKALKIIRTSLPLYAWGCMVLTYILNNSL